MFDRIFVESQIMEHPQVKRILDRLHRHDVIEISQYDHYFGRFKKPYLQKRESLNLYLAHKKGELVKPAPPAYGLNGEDHYYFVHAYNCIYECDYCYLQGYFQSPDLVIFVNHDEILTSMKQLLNERPDNKIWFHAGEFSDSLALTHITGELELYHHFCQENSNAIIELRTKSVNFRELKNLVPLENFIVSMSLASEKQVKVHDHKTPSYRTRLKALEEISNLGHPIGLHFDPIIFNENYEEQYTTLFKDISNHINLNNIRYISLGVVRFPKEIHQEMLRNYPQSPIHAAEFIKSKDGKIRYPKPLRLHLLNRIRELGVLHGFEASIFYLCMED